jgi:hypothetical protein
MGMGQRAVLAKLPRLALWLYNTFRNAFPNVARRRSLKENLRRFPKKVEKV